MLFLTFLDGQGKQEPDDIVPGGYITYVILNKDSADSLTLEHSWTGFVAHGISFVTNSAVSTSKPLCSILLALPSTNSLSRKLLCCGFEPSLVSPSKIIYDESSGDMYVIPSSSVGVLLSQSYHYNIRFSQGMLHSCWWCDLARYVLCNVRIGRSMYTHE